MGRTTIKMIFTKEALFLISICIELKEVATYNAVQIFANSAGCKLTPPIMYQEVAPEIFCPKRYNPNKLRIAII